MSDADRERVAERLREHFAEGRLTTSELDERISAALSAKTIGQLRAVMTDLPEPVPARPAAPQPAGPWAGRPVYVYRRRPRLLPLVLILLLLAVVLPGAGFAVAAFLRVILLVWLVVCVAGIIASVGFRRHVRRSSRSGPGGPWGL